MASVVVCLTDGTVERREVETLEEMQAVVGGMVELVSVGREYCVWVNEEGIGLDLPINQKAGRWLKKVLAEHGKRLLTKDGWLLGNAFVSGYTTSDSELADAPEGLELIINQA